MGWQNRSTYYARKPLRAEHPIGSGTIVEYQPGDVIPAGEWGASANWLVENGRAAEMFDNVWVDDVPAPQVEQVHERDHRRGDGFESGPPGVVNPNVDESAPKVPYGIEAFPLSEGGGWFRTSDGSRIRGAKNAQAAQDELVANGATVPEWPKEAA